jgi:hypothetical protein
MIEKRVKIFATSISIILCLAGLIIIVSQLVKISPLLESYPGWNFTGNDFVTILIGALLLFFGRKKFIDKAVNYSLFTGREKTKRLIVSLPISIVFLIIIVKLILGHDSHEYTMMTFSEGSIIEMATALSYILGFCFSIPIANYIFKSESKIWGLIYYLFAIILLFIGLEEMSYGQHLIGWNSPESFQKYNVQSETNIHNLKWFDRNLVVMYMTLGLIEFFAWLMIYKTKVFSSLKLLKYFVPNWFQASFFLTAAIFAAFLEFSSGFNFLVPSDEEVIELIIALGFFFIVITNFFSQAIELKYSQVSSVDYIAT